MGKGSGKTLKGSRKCTITEIYNKKNGFVNPAIVTFQNGDLKDQSLDLGVVLTPTSDGTTVEVETSFGHVFKESNFSKKPGHTQIIAIRNKTTSKVRLIEVDSAILINSVLLSSSAANTIDTEYGKKIKDLYRTFGGKKAVSQVVRAEKLNFSSMPVAEELKQTIAELKVEADVSIKQSQAESILTLLPPCHRDAVLVSQVYQIKDILSEEELESLTGQIKVMEESKFNPEEYSKFFVNCYSEAKKSEENVDIRLAGILFVETLINFLKIPARNLSTKKTALCALSAVIREKLLSEFCNRKEHSVSRSQAMKDKCVCYIIVLCLICCNYQIDLELLQTAITSVNLKRLLQLAKIVGATPASKEGHLHVLKLPLPALPTCQKGRLRKK